MTELETMQRAKMYLDKLSRGIDPITDREMPEDAVLNHVRICRCLHYVSGVLDQVIANGGAIGEKAPFAISRERMASIPLSSQPVRISDFTEVLNRAADDPSRKKLKATDITNWLLERGYLQKELGPDGKQRRAPTELGLRSGISAQMQQGQNGYYLSISYDINAQRLILDHLEEILGA